MEEYELENNQLRNAVDILTRELSKLEKTATNHQALQSSILEFRNQMANSKRNNKESYSISSSSEKLVTQLEIKNRELVKENSELRSEVEKYKVRWEKLKEYLVF